MGAIDYLPNHGARRALTFLDVKGRWLSLHTLSGISSKAGSEIHAWCLRRASISIRYAAPYLFRAREGF